MLGPEDRMDDTPPADERSGLRRTPYLALAVAGVVVSTAFATVAMLAGGKSDEAQPERTSQDRVQVQDGRTTTDSGSSLTTTPTTTPASSSSESSTTTTTTTSKKKTSTRPTTQPTQPTQPTHHAADPHHDDDHHHDDHDHSPTDDDHASGQLSLDGRLTPPRCD